MQWKNIFIVVQPCALKKVYRAEGRQNFADLVTFLGRQMPFWGVWEVGKTKISCKEAGSVQYKAHRARAPPHAYQLIKVRSWSRVSISYINWQAKIRNKLKNGKK